ncbi:hypothetical protein J4423_01530 [Candidatus Pacearchaeota archaeon]|nr:hypothetical protein [Candidatus Pacearchaeota archaeon]
MDNEERTDLPGIIREILGIRVGSGKIMSIRKEGRDVYLLQRLGLLGETLGDNLESYTHLVLPSDIDYGKIVLDAEAREFFPGVRKQFILETNKGPFLMHRQHDSYLNAPRRGEADRSMLSQLGRHGVRPFITWYQKNPDVEVGSKIKIYKAGSERFILEK